MNHVELQGTNYKTWRYKEQILRERFFTTFDNIEVLD